MRLVSDTMDRESLLNVLQSSCFHWTQTASRAVYGTVGLQDGYQLDGRIVFIR